jgi:hypothetical protein
VEHSFRFSSRRDAKKFYLLFGKIIDAWRAERNIKSEGLTHNSLPFTKNDQKMVDTEKIEKADTSYPIDIMENKGRWLILDGLHRLVKLYEQGEKTVKVRIIPRKKIPEITREIQNG